MTNLYQPETKIFYGPIDNDDNRLIPAPNISISIEYNYSNDTIIGYTYIVNLTGFATSLDLRNLDYGDEITEPSNYNTGSVVDHINKLRNTLTKNGSILYVLNGLDDSVILKAKGGILRSFSIEDSPNNWIHYANYSATLEFHSIDFVSKTEEVCGSFLDPSTYNAQEGSILDLTKFKIKSFNDSWSFSFDENEAFNRIKNNELGLNLDINNHGFNIQYQISAVGKHVFSYTNELTNEQTLLPAWEQAKNFVQERLYKQVKSLIGNVLKDYSSTCTSSDGLDDILTPGNDSGLLNGLSNYKVFNEQITCEASEAEGSFSATYSAIIKSSLGNTFWSSPETKHTVNKSIKTNNTVGNSITNISINGTIEGLIEGGLIRTNEPLELPKTGSFLIYKGAGISKYTNAKNLLDKIYSDNDYSAGLGDTGKRDLKPLFKNILGVNLAQLGGLPAPNDPIPDPPHPISFNLTHDYNNGTINYSVEYSSNALCGRKFTDITIQTSNPNKVTAIFNIPNSNNCPLIQELGTYTAKTVNLTVQGMDFSDIGQPPDLDIVDEINTHLNLGCYDIGYLPITLPPSGTYIITQQQYTKNPLDGSFTVNVSYICGSGCSISN